jgi:hypothetical protein
MTRKRDLAWEALVEATRSNPEMERGRLNTALKAIRWASMQEGIHDDDLPDEIHRRAEAYERRWPNLTLTSTALATHWRRVLASPAAASQEQRKIDEMRGRQ